MSSLHPTAIVDESATIEPEVCIGPFAIIGPGVRVGRGTEICARATVERNANIGSGCYIGSGAIIGGDPQDLKFSGEATWVDIGDNTRIREYVTVNRGTAASERTVVGSGCLLMSYVHVGHDCRIGDDVVLANGVELGGHVLIGDSVVVGGSTSIHQFVRVGERAFIGGRSSVPRDIPPYTKAAGDPLKLYGTNTVGLRRAGVSSETRLALKRAYRLIFNSELPLSQALTKLKESNCTIPEVHQLLEFVTSSERGVSR